jgi:hypothetical protein
LKRLLTPHSMQLTLWLAAFAAMGVLFLPARAAPDGRLSPATRPASEIETIQSLVISAATGHDVPKGPDDWWKTNSESVIDIGGNPLPGQPWGQITSKPARGDHPRRLYLHLFDWHASGQAVVYGLDAEVRRAYLLADPKKTQLNVEKTERDVIVDVGAKNSKAPDPADTVVVLELAEEVKVNSLVIPQSADGSILLHAKEAIVHGTALRYEPQPSKNTVGYWTRPTDWVRWEFSVTKPAMYSVQILQGCGKGSGGSEMDLEVDGQVLSFTVQDTRSFQNFVLRDIGKVTLAEGKHTLTVKPRKKQGVAIMDLRQVTLKP